MTNATVYSNPVSINESDITFRTLYEYIQQAERDEFGYNFPFGKEIRVIGFPGKEDMSFPDESVSLHIYEGRKQVNVTACGIHAANFIFDPSDESVRLVRVNESEVADYDSEPFYVSFDTPISDGGIGWSEYFGNIGGSVKEVFRDLLPAYLKSLMPEEPVNDNAVVSASEVDIMMQYGIISQLLNDINGILANYPRYIGNMVMVSMETENEIENKCNIMLEAIATMKQPGYLDCTLNKDEILKALAGVEEQANRDLAEVARAKEFLARYYSH